MRRLPALRTLSRLTGHCSARLPAELVVDRAQNATQWARWWRPMDAQYGTNHPRCR